MKTWQQHHGEPLDAVNGYDVIRCEPCGFAHAIPIPSPEELARFYAERFYDEKADYFEKHRADQDWWRLGNEERYARFESLLGGPGRILDVGSGPGFFLALGRERGWSALGVEPSVKASAHARGLGVEVRTGALDDALARELGSFDVVHSGWVIEHVRDAPAFLALCRSLARPGGLVCIAAANDYNPLQAILREQEAYRPWWLVPPEHLNYFTVDTLRATMARAGLEPVHVTTTFPMELFLLMGDNYVGDGALGRASHLRRKRLEVALAKSELLPLRRALYEAFAAHGVGRDTVITARRPA